MTDIEKFIQDNIGYREKPFVVLTDPKATKCLYDKTTKPVLDLLKEKPMTRYDLEIELNKSQKTIYRYLKKLEEAGLIVKGGKRIINEKGEYKVYTLFSRTAKIYYDNYSTKFVDEELKIETKAEHRNKIMSLVAKLLGQLYENQKGDIGMLWTLYKDIEIKKLEYIERLMSSADDEMLDFISTLTTLEVAFIIDMIGIFAILREKQWEKQVLDSFY